MLGLPLTALGLWLCSAFLSVSSATEVQGDSSCADLMCVAAYVNGSSVTYQLTALVQMGWMAIGFGTIMQNSAMVILWPNPDGSVTLSQRTATGEVEPVTDPSPPRIANTYAPLTSLGSTSPSLAFTIPKNNDTNQTIIWALGTANPDNAAPGANLEQHLESGSFSLNLTSMVDLEPVPTGSTSTGFIPVVTGSPSAASPSTTAGASSANTSSDGTPLKMFEKLIIGHASLSAFGFLFTLPLGALVARLGRTVSPRWFNYHWGIEVVISIPIVVVGWSLGPLAVAEQGLSHANDAHKICGILLLPLFLVQLALGSFVHLRRPKVGRLHPPQNIVHAILGIIIIGLAFSQARTGFMTEWATITKRSINSKLLSKLWIAWIIIISLLYFTGFALIPKQLRHEEQIPPYPPPPYSPTEQSSGSGLRGLLELGPADDGTHGEYSEHPAESTSDTSDRIEMRELERPTPVFLAAS